jgi:hypothetical protein
LIPQFQQDNLDHTCPFQHYLAIMTLCLERACETTSASKTYVLPMLDVTMRNSDAVGSESSWITMLHADARIDAHNTIAATQQQRSIVITWALHKSTVTCAILQEIMMHMGSSTFDSACLALSHAQGRVFCEGHLATVALDPYRSLRG